jgi:hypothetical protein
MSGGGVGNVLSTGASLAAGQSPLGAFGSALGSQLLSGSGGGGGSGAGAPAGGIGGIGRQNQTQLVGPMAGVNPASPAYNIMMQQQSRPQVLPQVTPQVQQPAPQAVPPQALPPAFYQNYLRDVQQLGQAPFQAPNGNFGVAGGMGGGLPAQGGGPAPFVPFNQWVQSQNQNPNVPALTTQQLQDKYKAEMTGLGGMGLGGVGQVQPMPRPGPQVQPIRRPLPMSQMGGLAGLAGMLQGRQ